MNIYVTDYRGDDTVINSRGDTLYNYRTVYFHKFQQEFSRWQKHGHRFICYTQHTQGLLDDYPCFDEVVQVPRARTEVAKNRILDDVEASGDDWFGIWDNDATLYWNRLRSEQLPQELDLVCEKAEEQNIVAFVPFDSSKAPYSTVQDTTQWQFKPTVNLRSTMMFQRNPGVLSSQRCPTQFTASFDLAYAYELTSQGHRLGMLQQASLREMGNNKSTIFEVSARHEQYKKPGPNANPLGLLQWDGQVDRKDKYKQAQQEFKQHYGLTNRDYIKLQRSLW